MAKKGQVTLVPSEMADELITQIKSLDAKFATMRGTQSQRLKQAAADVQGVLQNWTPPTVTLEGDAWEQAAELQRHSEYLTDVRSKLEVVAYNLKRPANEDLDGVREQRKALAEKVAALNTMFDLGIEIPKAPGAGGRPPGSTGTKRSAKGHYSVILNGNEVHMPDSQDSLSSVAHYHGHKLLGVEGSAGTVKVAQLREAIGDDESKDGDWSHTFDNDTQVKFVKAAE